MTRNAASARTVGTEISETLSQLSERVAKMENVF